MIEYKLQPELDWASAPVIIKFAVDEVAYFREKQEALAHALAKALAKMFNCEVRWNVMGSLQGHYVSP